MNRNRTLMMEYTLIMVAYAYLLDNNAMMAAGVSLCAAVFAVWSHSLNVFRRRYSRIIASYLFVMCGVYLTPLPSLLNGLPAVILAQCIFTVMWLEDSVKVLRPTIRQMGMIFLSMVVILVALTPEMMGWFYVTSLQSFAGYLMYLSLLFLFVPAAYMVKKTASLFTKYILKQKPALSSSHHVLQHN